MADTFLTDRKRRKQGGYGDDGDGDVSDASTSSPPLASWLSSMTLRGGSSSSSNSSNNSSNNNNNNNNDDDYEYSDSDKEEEEEEEEEERDPFITRDINDIPARIRNMTSAPPEPPRPSVPQPDLPSSGYSSRLLVDVLEGRQDPREAAWEAYYQAKSDWNDDVDLWDLYVELREQQEEEEEEEEEAAARSMNQQRSMPSLRGEELAVASLRDSTLAEGFPVEWIGRPGSVDFRTLAKKKRRKKKKKKKNAKSLRRRRDDDDDDGDDEDEDEDDYDPVHPRVTRICIPVAYDTARVLRSAPGLRGFLRYINAVYEVAPSVFDALTRASSSSSPDASATMDRAMRKLPTRGSSRDTCSLLSTALLAKPVLDAAKACSALMAITSARGSATAMDSDVAVAQPASMHLDRGSLWALADGNVYAVHNKDDAAFYDDSVASAVALRTTGLQLNGCSFRRIRLSVPLAGTTPTTDSSVYTWRLIHVLAVNIPELFGPATWVPVEFEVSDANWTTEPPRVEYGPSGQRLQAKAMMRLAPLLQAADAGGSIAAAMRMDVGNRSDSTYQVELFDGGGGGGEAAYKDDPDDLAEAGLFMTSVSILVRRFVTDKVVRYVESHYVG
jgi:hypothetical protein